MQALKAVVAALGILIVIAMVAIGWGLYRKGADPAFSFFGRESGPRTAAPGTADRPDGPIHQPGGPARGEPFGTVSLDLAAPCTIADLRPDGNRVYVLIAPAVPACPRVVVIDAGDGQVLGTFVERP